MSSTILTVVPATGRLMLLGHWRAFTTVGAILAALLLGGCNIGVTPATPTPIPTTIPVATRTPTLTPTPTPTATTTGEVYLGIEYETLTSLNSTQYNIRDENGKVLTTGVLVTGVDSGSPAKQAGVQVGDVILAINGYALTEDLRIFEVLSAKVLFQPGDTVPLTIVRNGKRIQLQVTLGTKR